VRLRHRSPEQFPLQKGQSKIRRLFRRVLKAG
jgi:hypothetical protein